MGKDNVTVAGVLHPGQMGSSVASALVEAGHKVCWASEERSSESLERATELKLQDCENLSTLCKTCNVLFSVCPPAEALNVAKSVASQEFSGVYVDCNAVSPMTSSAVFDVFTGVGVDYVDGGIIGPPAWKAETTRLYLSGNRATDVANMFSGSLLGVETLGYSSSAASAMKMAYAAWTKGSAALLLNVYAMAEQHGFGDTLRKEWNQSQPGLENKLESLAHGTAPKAWRFVGEMQEIAATFTNAGLNPGAFDSAAGVYKSMSDFKSSNPEDITTEKVIRSIVDGTTHT